MWWCQVSLWEISLVPLLGGCACGEGLLQSLNTMSTWVRRGRRDQGGREAGEGRDARSRGAAGGLPAWACQARGLLDGLLVLTRSAGIPVRLRRRAPGAMEPRPGQHGPPLA